METAATAQKKKTTFRKFIYRGVDFEDLIQMPIQTFANLLTARDRRRIQRGFSQSEIDFLLACEKSKIAAEGSGDKPAVVTTQCRQMLILPQLVGCIVGVYNGKEYITFEVKPEMIGHRLAHFSSPHKMVSHGRPGIGATSSSKFVPLK
ncbi:small subunit ribosomal protein S15e [Nematocida homosporus]|uniref:small subunit ribosomal protein S15e n=1 Tax=Nematocida homosporus TaxID=1912981 RepID=UPI00222101BD|nr:small subunit ribosomal protein S15e [Nematocida homosporus]KAI5186536.1 small subunit ribosomal protein S15e [Nematocida homosporus]